MGKSETQNKIANHKVDDLYAMWQEFVDNYRTFSADIECDIKQARGLLDDL